MDFNEAYYSTMAQVIPVFFLFLAFSGAGLLAILTDAKTLRDRDPNDGRP